MALQTTLFTGLSGLMVNQIALDVVGNNIANANTIAFKGSRALFETQLSETRSFGTPPGDVHGGTNPMQKGLGASVQAIQRNFSDGNVQATNLRTDVAIQGQGFFILEGLQRSYTRTGAFDLNSQHYLTSADGRFLMGYGVDSEFNILRGDLQRLQIPLGLMTTATPTSEANLAGQLRAKGDLATVGTQLVSQEFTVAGGGVVDGATRLSDLQSLGGAPLYEVGQNLTLKAEKGGRTQQIKTLAVGPDTTVQNLMDFMVTGYGIHTGGGVPGDPGAQIVAGGTGYRIQLNGNVGGDNALTFGTGTLTGPLTFAQTGQANGESVYTASRVFDSLGNPLQLEMTFVLEARDDNTTTWRFYANSPDDTGPTSALSTGTVTFDSMGQYLSGVNQQVTIYRANSGAITPMAVNLDLSHIQALTVPGSRVSVTYQNGSEAGTLQDFSIGGDGTITGTFSNGITRTLGRLGLATFSNPEGLIDAGGGNYIPGPNSGEAVIGAAMESGAGTMIGGALETSNIDISNEFIGMIMASTGFSASSRVITASNQLLTELLNIVR